MNQPPAPPGGWGPPPPPGAPAGPPGGYGVGLPPGVDPMMAAGGPVGGGPSYGSQQEPMAIVSLVLGVVSIPLFGCCGLLSLAANIAGLIVGFVSLSRLNREPERYTGKPLAIAGLVINAVLTLLAVLMTIFFFGMMGFGILTSP